MNKPTLRQRLKLAWRVFMKRPTICFVTATMEEGYVLQGSTLGRLTFHGDDMLVINSEFYAPGHAPQYTTANWVGGPAARRLLQLAERGGFPVEDEAEHTQ